MNTLNRVLIVALAFFSVVLWAGAVFSIWAFPKELSSSLGTLAAYLRANVTFVQVMVTIFGVASILVALLLLLAEVGPQEASVVKLPGIKDGTAFVSTETIIQQVMHYVGQIPQVHLVQPMVSPAGTALDMRIELRIDSDSNISEKADEVCRVVKECVEGKMGLKLRQLTVNIQHEPFISSATKATSLVSPAVGTGSPNEILVPSALAEQEKSQEPKDKE